MARRYPTRRPPAAAQVVRYVDPVPQQPVVLNPEQFAVYQARQLAAEAEKKVLHARWKARQAAIRERDAKVRRFWLGFGAVFALLILAGLVVLGWLLWTSVGLGVLAVPVVIVLSIATAVGGHRCITVVQHWH